MICNGNLRPFRSPEFRGEPELLGELLVAEQRAPFELAERGRPAVPRNRAGDAVRLQGAGAGRPLGAPGRLDLRRSEQPDGGRLAVGLRPQDQEVWIHTQGVREAARHDQPLRSDSLSASFQMFTLIFYIYVLEFYDFYIYKYKILLMTMGVLVISTKSKSVVLDNDLSVLA